VWKDNREPLTKDDTGAVNRADPGYDRDCH